MYMVSKNFWKSQNETFFCQRIFSHFWEWRKVVYVDFLNKYNVASVNQSQNFAIIERICFVQDFDLTTRHSPGNVTSEIPEKLKSHLQ